MYGFFFKIKIIIIHKIYRKIPFIKFRIEQLSIKEASTLTKIQD